MAILVTGAAGFVGAHLCRRLLQQGERVIGVDDLNPYYDPQLKRDRLETLCGTGNFSFEKLDIADGLGSIDSAEPIRTVVHLAAQAGVRYSIDNPGAYIRSNLVGHGAVLEFCRHLDGLDQMIFASSSSVYGGSGQIPFSEDQQVDKPVSLYAATKKADELLSYSYSHLYGLNQVGLRFFTVYGEWGRPDMAYWTFTDAILKGKPIQVFNQGNMRRDFTYIDDVISGILSIIEAGPPVVQDGPPYKIYNIGNHRAEPLLRMIEILEEAIGRPAEKIMAPMQPGDVKETFADISALARDYGFHPSTSIDIGLPRFVSWYRDYHGV